MSKKTENIKLLPRNFQTKVLRCQRSERILFSIRETLNLLTCAYSTTNIKNLKWKLSKTYVYNCQVSCVMCQVLCVTCHLSPTPTAIGPPTAKSPTRHYLKNPSNILLNNTNLKALKKNLKIERKSNTCLLSPVNKAIRHNPDSPHAR